MKTVIYHEGPDRVTAGIAGELVRGVSKELPDEIADMLCGDPMYQIQTKDSSGDLNGSNFQEKKEVNNVTGTRQ